jgi:hypothetical protein
LPNKLDVLPSGSGATNNEQCFPGFHQPPGLFEKQIAEILSVVAFKFFKDYHKSYMIVKV